MPNEQCHTAEIRSFRQSLSCGNEKTHLLVQSTCYHDLVIKAKREGNQSKSGVFMSTLEVGRLIEVQYQLGRNGSQRDLLTLYSKMLVEK